jgi:hypothetical protein
LPDLLWDGERVSIVPGPPDWIGIALSVSKNSSRIRREMPTWFHKVDRSWLYGNTRSRWTVERIPMS